MDQALSDIGIISAYRFADDGVGDEARHRQSRRRAGRSARLAVAAFQPRPTAAATTGSRRKAPLSDIARETLLDPDEHIRLDIFGDEIAGVLPDLHQEFMQEGDDLVRVHFAISRG